jgi:A/G-specific adenine glycosylase
MPPVPESPIADALLAWHARHGRHDLPWLHERTPYRVWVSEIMLQQTQVATVIGYYQRFMRHFPDIGKLADAPLDEVLHLWSGLGYYSRARNLHRAAERICRVHGGELPDDAEALQALPGIGRSTAAAILALAFGQRASILDGNVRRLLSRFFGIEGTANDRATLQQLWRRAEQCTPSTDVATYTQAIMDFGATLCTRHHPQCARCPLRSGCEAHRSARVPVLPAPRPRAARRRREVVMLLAVRGDGRVLLQRRPPSGVWGGLWSPPEFSSEQAAALFCSRHLLGMLPELQPLPPLQHAFTHFDLTIMPLRACCQGPAGVMEGPDTLWYNAREPARIGLPAPITTLLSSLES